MNDKPQTMKAAPQVPLYANEKFSVSTIMFNDPLIEEVVVGYGIYNIDTGVREAEVRRLDIAVQLADAYQESHARLWQERAEAHNEAGVTIQ